MKYVLFAFCLMTINQLVAQDTYTDYKPSYRQWVDDVMLDKIEYTKISTIFYFRYVSQNTSTLIEAPGVTFYPPGGEYPWYIKGRNIKKDFSLKGIRNLCRNGKLMKSNISSTYSLDGLNGSTVFTCEVHFDRFSSDLEIADLIEGAGEEYNRNHFNLFAIKLKTAQDPELGSKKDSYKRIYDFEKEYGINSNDENLKNLLQSLKKINKTHYEIFNIYFFFLPVGD